MQIKGIIFDFDGTLANTMPAILSGFRACFSKFLGNNYSDSQIESLFGPTEEGIIKQLVPNQWEECYAEYLNHYRQGHPAQPFNGIEDALKILKDKGICLSIGTGKGKGSLTASLEIVGLNNYFDLLEVGSEAGAVKPEIIARVLKRWGFAATEVAYIGDVASDVSASRQAGVLALSAAWSPSADIAQLQAVKPDAIFVTVADFIDWIESHIKKDNVCGE